MITQELLKEAVERYPVGTLVTNENLGIYCKFTIETKIFEIHEDTSILTVQKNGTKYTVYVGQEWAEILKYPENYVSNTNELIFQSL
jgi:hypothetical protein